MIVIGIVGGVASGKSQVARAFEQLGAVVIDADRIGHEVLNEPEVQQMIRRRWGAEVIDANGQVRRNILAKIVFAARREAPGELEHLEQITHPRIAGQLKKRLQDLKASGAVAAVLDAPVLFKAGWDMMCDQIVFVYAGDEQRQHRASTRGWTVDQWRSREASQTPLEVQRARSTAEIDNSGPWPATMKQVESLWRRWHIAQ